MDLTALLRLYGGPALFVGAWLEGEAAVILGGALARQGYWPWWGVALVAMIPAIAGHQIYFWLGRRYGPAILRRLPAHLHPAAVRAQALVQRRETWILALMRFAYGIRLPLPILCGAAGVASAKFVAFNVGTAVVWALVFAALGYGFGAAATAVFHRWAHDQAIFLLASLAFGVLVHVVTRRLGRKPA